MEILPIYLDSNVIIDMADGREDELLGLIMRSNHFSSYRYPFSAEVINEITDDNLERSNSRLLLLQDISKDLYFEHSINSLGYRRESVFSIYDTLNEVALGKGWESDIANFVTFEQQLEARKAYGLVSSDLNNLSPEKALQTINNALAKYAYQSDESQFQPPKSLDDFMAYCEANMKENFTDLWLSIGADIKTQLKNMKIVNLFSLIDSLGFWCDSKKTYKKGSRLADSRHAFNGSYFQIVVSRDKRFLKKSEAAYNYFGINTQCISTDNFKKLLTDNLS